MEKAMNIRKNIPVLDQRILGLIDLIEMASASLRSQGKEVDAIALFRLRASVREGLPFMEAQAIFEEHTKSVMQHGEKHLA